MSKRKGTLLHLFILNQPYNKWIGLTLGRLSVKTLHVYSIEFFRYEMKNLLKAGFLSQERNHRQEQYQEIRTG